MLATCPKNATTILQSLITLLDQPNSIPQLKQIHAILLTSGLSTHHPFPTKLVRAATAVHSGNADYSRRLLRQFPASSVVEWNKVIRVYSSSKTPNKSIRVFAEMLRFGVFPDHFTFPFVVKASARIYSVKHGMSVHSYVLRSGYELDLYVMNSLIHMYGSCGEIVYARKVFDEMPMRTNVSWNSMLDGYAKCGDLMRAREVFESMPEKNVVSWSAIIDGCVNGGEYKEALDVFERMKVMGRVKANEVTMVSVLCACTHLGALEKGRLMHRYIIESKLSLTDLTLLTSLMDMYAKCGAIEEAFNLFRGIQKEKSDVFLWNSIIGGLANHGYVQESLDLFVEMSTVGVAPDEITYLCLLSACSHGGLVTEAWRFFEAIERNGMILKSAHYACMIDAMVRAGQIEKAYDFSSRMPVEPTPSMLGALLSGCMNHGRLDLAEQFGQKLIEVDPYHDGRYVGLANVYAAVKRWDDANTMRKAMNVTGVKKIPGSSSVEISGALHMFIAHDNKHPESVEIYAMVNFILTQMRKVSEYGENDILC